MRRRTIAASAAVLVLTLSACATGVPMSEQSPSSRPPFQTTTPGTIGPSGIEPTGTSAAVPQGHWDAIVDDLTARGVDGAPVLVSAEQVVFNDGSLGCPTPGQSYTQAQIDGMRVIVEVDGVRYDYRFGTGPTPTLCTR